MHEGDVRAALAPLGWDDARQDERDALGIDHADVGRVVRVDRGGGAVATAAGTVGVAGPGLAVGDWVALRDGRVAAVMERRTVISRRAAGRADIEQVIAANVDVVVAVQAMDRPLRMRRLHRALALGWESGAVPVVVLAKCDVGDARDAALRVGELGVDVIAVSARTGEGLADVAALARPARTVVLLGESGAGKSTLANALTGDAHLPTAAVRAGDGKGRHTTTARHLLALPGGGALIDTPGVRELGLWSDAAGGIGITFADVEELAPGCRFADCRHDTEPGCAVRAAVERGDLAVDRLESWRELAREVAAQARRADARAARAHARAGSLMARGAVRRAGRDRGRR